MTIRSTKQWLTYLLTYCTHAVPVWQSSCVI